MTIDSKLIARVPRFRSHRATAHSRRVAELRAQHAEVAALSEYARRERLEVIVATELNMTDVELRRSTEARLHAWAALARVDPGAARAIARSYAVVFNRTLGELEFRRSVAAQAAATADFWFRTWLDEVELRPRDDEG